jgi:hypothetical protein
MLTGAAILFVLGTAIIAFQGWPRIANQTSPPAAAVNAAPAQPSRVSRRLHAVVVLRRARPGAVPPAAGGHRILAGTERAGTAPSAPAGASPGPATGSLRSAALTETETATSKRRSLIGG